nr:hypothetical protein [uncultured Treponema sp.]
MKNIVAFIFLLGFAAWFFKAIPGLEFIGYFIHGTFRWIWNTAGNNPIVFIIVFVCMFAAYRYHG